jgi:superfamily II DNA or RNA helicase
MQIIDNKALLLKLRNPKQITTIIPKSKLIGDHEVVVSWGVTEAQTLRGMNIKVPSPIEGRYSWTGKYAPMTHQKTTASFLTMHRRAFCFNEAGTGKTASAIWAADFLMKQGIVKRALVICPISIMDSAWRADLFSFAMHRTVGIAYGTAKQRKQIIAGKPDFLIINYDGLEIVKEDVAAAGYDLFIVDECFVAGTPVHTPNGLTAIEELKAGDAVFTSDGVHNIRTVSKRKPNSLVEVTFDTGETIICTPEHPFFTDWGWVPARALGGRRIVSSSALSDMRKPLQSGPEQMAVSPEDKNAHGDDLLSILRSEEMASPASGGVSLKEPDCGAEGEEYSVWVSPYARAARALIEGGDIERDSSDGSWRQRYGHDWGGDIAVGAASGWLGLELPNSVGQEAARLSYELQARLCMAGEETWVGGEWRQPSHDEGSGEGQEENGKAFGIRVESVTYREPGCDEYVYNLEVDGTPNYFVGEQRALVHNCSHYKNAQSTRWKVLNSLVTPDSWIWMMTGTPAAQGPEDAYGLAKLVNPAAVPRFAGAWRDIVMQKESQFRWRPKPTATESVFRVLQPAIRFTKEECLDLPDMTYVKRDVELTKQQETYYKRLKAQAAMEVAGEQITAVNAAVMMGKLLQISAGASYTESGDSVQFDIGNRYKILREVINESSHKVLIFVPFKHVIDMLSEKLSADGVTNEIIRGDVSAANRTDIFKRFQTSPDPRVLVIQPQSAAHGVTLTAANTVVWWAPTSSLETYAQANARVHRKGQTNKCTVVQLQGSGVERRVYKLLDEKIDIHTRVVDLYKDLLD